MGAAPGSIPPKKCYVPVKGYTIFGHFPVRVKSYCLEKTKPLILPFFNNGTQVRRGVGMELLSEHFARPSVC